MSKAVMLISSPVVSPMEFPSTFGNFSHQKENCEVKISVVIPTYRRAALLQNCLKCLIGQTLDQRTYEIIVVSDGPDEETKKLVTSLKLFHPFLFYLHLPHKKGPAAARNIGWQNASADLVAFTDDDCLPAADWLSSFLQLHKGREKQSHSVSEDKIAYTGKIKVPLSTDPADYEMNIAHLETAEFVTANCCCTRSALARVHGFDERFSMAWREDSDLQFKLLESRVPIMRAEEAIVVHPVRKAKWGVSIKEQKKGMFNALLYKKFPRLYRKKIQRNPPWNYYLIVVSLCFVVVSLICQLWEVALLLAIVWLLLTTRFILKRLRSTSKRSKHVVEMIATSFVIPCASVYWQLYGAVTYRVLFL